MNPLATGYFFHICQPTSPKSWCTIN